MVIRSWVGELAVLRDEVRWKADLVGDGLEVGMVIHC